MTKAIELSQLGNNIDVGTEIELSKPLRTNNAVYGNNTDVPYLIAGTTGYTGATTNWNTFGLQHRLKSNSSGTPRVTIDNSNGELFCVNNSGNVGIGTNSPGQLLDLQSSDPRINITDTDAGGIFQIRNTSGAGYLTTLGEHPLLFYTNSSESMRINSNGRVGIGTNSPSQALDVVTSTGNAYIRAARNSQSTGQVALALAGGTSGTDWILYQPTSSNDFRIFGNSGDRLTITSVGNVGIGTDNPDAKLDVNGKVAIQRPSDYWQNNTQVFFDDGNIPIGSIGHHGGFAVALTSNGYRNSSGQWTSHSANSYTGAAQVEVQPQGNIYFRTDSNKATGSSTNPTNRIHIDSLGRMRIGGTTPLYALDVRGESMSGLEYKAISSENGVLARECAGFGQGSDNSAGCGVECILHSNNINNNWVAFNVWVTAASCATTGASNRSAWWFYRCRVYAQSGFTVSLVDSGGDTSNMTVSFNDDGNVGTAIGLSANDLARQFEVRISNSGGQRTTLNIFVNSYPKIARFRRQP